MFPDPLDALQEDNPTAYSMNAQASIAARENNRFTIGCYYRVINVLRIIEAINPPSYIDVNIDSHNVTQTKFRFRIDSQHVYNAQHSFIVSYTYDNWMRSQVNVRWVMQWEYQRNAIADRQLKTYLKPMVPHFGPSLENHIVPQEIISSTGQEKRIEQRGTRLRALQNDLTSIAMCLAKHLTTEVQSHVENTAHTWLKLNVQERESVVGLTQLVGIPRELQILIGGDLLTKYLPDIENPEATMFILMKHIAHILQEDPNKTQKIYMFRNNRVPFYIQYYSEQLQLFSHLTSTKDNAAMLSINYYAWH